MIHIGKKIKEVVKAQNITVSQFAQKVHKSRTVIYSIFERESLDSHLLFRIGEALDYNFFLLYASEEKTINRVSEPMPEYGENYKVKFYSLLEKYTSLLECKIEDYFLK